MRRWLRFLGYVWATPTSLAAFVFFLAPFWLARQVRPTRWRDGVWEWSVVPHTWFWRRYTQRGWSGTSLGYCVIFSPGQAEVRRVALHERRHVWQSLWLGPLYFPVYALLFLFTGYRGHPMERDAYNWEWKHRG
jgi:hypothetical protein